MTRRFLSLLAGWFMMIVPAQAAAPLVIDASILVEDAPNATKQFVGYVTAHQPLEGRYELTGEKIGVAGNARVKQAGAIKAAPHQAVRLSHIAFGSIAADDHYSVQLKIFRGNELVGHAEIIK